MRPPKVRQPRLRWGRLVTTRSLAARLLLRFEGDYLWSRAGAGCAVLHLLGGDFALVDATLRDGRLRALQRYLDQSTGTLMRLSTSQPQELSRYAATLLPLSEREAERAPHLSARLQEVLTTMARFATQDEARLGLDYLVLATRPDWSVWRPGQGQAASREKMQAALDEQVEGLLLALRRAGVEARRIVGTELAALCVAAWQAPSAQVDLPPADLELEALHAWACQPEGDLLVAADTIQTEDGWLVRSWVLSTFSGSLAADLMLKLSRAPGMRVLQFAQRLPPEQIKDVWKKNRIVEASLAYLRPGGVRDYDDEARRLALEQQAAQLSFEGAQVYRYHALIQLWETDLARLEERARRLERVQFRDMGLVAHVATPQDEALASGVPAGTCLLTKPERNLDGRSLAHLFTPGPRDPLSASGFWLGTTYPDRLLFTLDFHRALHTPVVFLIGQMGSGKSVTLKSLLTQAACQGLPVIVIDAAPQAHEYTRPVQALGGVVVQVGQAEGEARFNPVFFDPALRGDPFLHGQSVFLDWLEIALRPFTLTERTVLKRAYQRAFQQAQITPEDRASWARPVPLLQDIQQALYEEESRAVLAGSEQDPQFLAHELAFLLEPFVSGHEAALFNRPTSLPDARTRVLCFDLADVPDGLQLACFQLVTAYTGGAILDRYRYERPAVFIDEGYQLLEDPRGARPIERWIRNARKASALLCFSAHTASDSQLNRSAQLAQATAGATLLFHVERQDEATLALYQLSAPEAAFVTRQAFEPGDCLLLYPGGHVPLHIDIPPTWYDDFTTRPEEVVALALAAEPAPLPPALSLDGSDNAARRVWEEVQR